MRPCLPQRRLGHPRRGLKRVAYFFEVHAASLPASKIRFQGKRLATSTANSHPVDEAAPIPTGSGIRKGAAIPYRSTRRVWPRTLPEIDATSRHRTPSPDNPAEADRALNPTRGK